MTAVSARGLEVRLGDARVLRGIDFRADCGEVVGVLGPSGAGKSTFFRTLVGDLPAQGTIEILDVNVTGWPLWRRARHGVGYVPQGTSVFLDLSVADNLLVFERVTGRSRPTMVAELGLSQRLGVRAGDLSGGERRRLELGRALFTAPKVLVCDEPFSGVDPQGAEALANLLRKLADEGVCVLLADHHVEEALRICTRAVLVLDGAIAAEGDPATFRDHPTVRGRYLGSWTRTLPPESVARSSLF